MKISNKKHQKCQREQGRYSVDKEDIYVPIPMCCFLKKKLKLTQ